MFNLPLYSWFKTTLIRVDFTEILYIRLQSGPSFLTSPLLPLTPTPYPSSLLPHPSSLASSPFSLICHPSSPILPHPSSSPFLLNTSSLLPHLSSITPPPSSLTPHPSPLIPHPLSLTHYPSPIIPHPSLFLLHSYWKNYTNKFWKTLETIVEDLKKKISHPSKRIWIWWIRIRISLKSGIQICIKTFWIRHTAQKDSSWFLFKKTLMCAICLLVHRLGGLWKLFLIGQNISSNQRSF